MKAANTIERSLPGAHESHGVSQAARETAPHDEYDGAGQRRAETESQESLLRLAGSILMDIAPDLTIQSSCTGSATQRRVGHRQKVSDDGRK